MAFEPSKFIKRQVHLQLMKVRNRNAADTLDQNAETIQKREGPHTTESPETLHVGWVASLKRTKH